jgi:hypothetical protein
MVYGIGFTTSAANTKPSRETVQMIEIWLGETVFLIGMRTPTPSTPRKISKVQNHIYQTKTYGKLQIVCKNLFRIQIASQHPT